MDRLRPFVVASAFMLLLVSPGHAADMPGEMPLPLPPARIDSRPALIDVHNGWYLRGDLGLHSGRIDGAQAVPPNADPIFNFLGNGMTGSVGAGIKGSWLRTDLTIDYASTLKYQGSVNFAGDTTAKVQATTGLFNGYLDLGTWYRMTPYIGAGAGVAYARVFDYANAANPPLPGDTARNQWKFAWVVMAGAAAPLSQNLMLDLGYRYLNIGDLSTGSGAIGTLKLKNIAAHEVRIGLRWSFDDPR
jgi:opacity protein-like surface antigen